MATQPSSPVITSAPTNKAVAATGGSAIGAAIATIVLHFVDPHNSLQPDLRSAIITLVTALVTLAAAYFTPPGISEAVAVDENGKIRTARAAPLPAAPTPLPADQ